MEFGSVIDEKINARVKRVSDALAGKPVKGVIEVVPTFRSLLVYYDPCVISFKALSSALRRLDGDGAESERARKRIVHIPVLYGGAAGEDIADVAAHAGISESEVVRLHSEREYLIYMMGFLPGFAYLGGMNEKLVTPRLKNPRTKIPQGSVGIGGEQTGVYPLSSPGGWRLIGTTPVKPYDPQRQQPFLYTAGDYIKFDAVSKEEYDRIENLVAKNEYECVVEAR
jgi:KipI family sensor histidine kinase inhibitor